MDRTISIASRLEKRVIDLEKKIHALHQELEVAKENLENYNLFRDYKVYSLIFIHYQ